jgi:hypothetical protein
LPYFSELARYSESLFTSETQYIFV